MLTVLVQLCGFRQRHRALMAALPASAPTKSLPNSSSESADCACPSDGQWLRHVLQKIKLHRDPILAAVGVHLLFDAVQQQELKQEQQRQPHCHSELERVAIARADYRHTLIEANVLITMVWELHAHDHLNGRLVLGCCHLRCNNLEGASEACLPTKLCSGCKRVRYRSLGCQKAAWQRGGHHLVCQKQPHDKI